jgi:hypothetical protein
MYIILHVQYPLFLSDFMQLNFLNRFLQNTQNIKFPVGAELFLADGQT